MELKTHAIGKEDVRLKVQYFSPKSYLFFKFLYAIIK